MFIGNRGWVLPCIFRMGTVLNVSLHRYTCIFPYSVSNRVRGNFPRIYTDLFSLYHSPFLSLALSLSGEFPPAFVSEQGTQRNRDLRVFLHFQFSVTLPSLS